MNTENQNTQSKPVTQALSDPAASVFYIEGTSVYQGPKLVVSVWPSRKANEDRMNGESWLDMRKRTASAQLDIELETKRMAQEICEFLNSQNK